MSLLKVVAIVFCFCLMNFTTFVSKGQAQSVALSGSEEKIIGAKYTCYGDKGGNLRKGCKLESKYREMAENQCVNSCSNNGKCGVSSFLSYGPCKEKQDEKDASNAGAALPSVP